MRGFTRIPSLVQIWLAQMLVLLFFSDPVIRLVQLVARPKTGILKTKFDWFDLVPWAIGLLCLVWLMATIFRPRLGPVRWVPVFRAGPLPVWNSGAAITYSFPSTHPSYVFMDALAAGFAYFIYWAWSSAWEERRLEGILILGLGLLTPVARLFAWYILGLRPQPPGSGAEATRHTEDALREAWRPVFAFYAIVVPVLALAGGVAWYQIARDERQRIAAAIRIDPAQLPNARYFQEIRDTGTTSQRQSRLAWIAIETSTEGARCEHATVKSAVHYNIRANFGAAGEIMLVMKPEQREQIAARRAKGESGPSHLLGILVHPPAPHAIPAWRQHVYCSLPRAAVQPRWIFEVEQVLPWTTKSLHLTPPPQRGK